MYPQTDLLFYRFRFLFAGIVSVVLLVVVSTLVTAVGSNSILDPKTRSSEGLVDSATYDTSNVVTDGVYNLMYGTERALLSAGVALYEGCQSITNATVQSGKSIARASAATARGIGSGAMFVGRTAGSTIALVVRTAGSGIVFAVHLPGKIVSPVANGKVVSAIIKPAADTSVPTISSETSAAVLASFNAQQRQEIVEWQADQLAANRKLGGSIVAGDPNHGGYPANWDTARQDRMLDSWGMYNRECVSYAAWKVYQTYGSMPYWGGRGNANRWVRDAVAAGIPTGSTPQVHSVAISMRGYYGHAMWVESVRGDMIYVSQYNYDLHGHYSEMWVKANSFSYIYFK